MRNKKLLLLAFAVMVFSAQLNSVSNAQTQKYQLKINRTYEEYENLINQGKHNEASSKCQRILERDPNNADARTCLGSVYSAQYKLDAAQREFIRVLQQDPNNPVAHNGLGMVYYKKTASSDMEILKNLDKYHELALREFTTAIKLAPDYYKAYNNAGIVVQKMGKLDEAEIYYRKALEIEPKYSDALENLGSILFAKGKSDEAIAKYKESIDLNSKNSSAYYRLGEALLDKGNYSQAIKYLQTSLYLYPNSAPVHYNLGRAYELQGNEAAAISEYKKSFMIKPEYPLPYMNLANIYQNRGDDEFALSELKSAITVNPEFMEGKLKIADISLNIGKPDQAIKYYKEVMNDTSYANQAIKGLSKAYFVKAQQASSYADLASESEYVEAEKAIKTAISHNPDDLQLYLALLRISRLTSSNDKGEAYLSKIIESPANQAIDHVVKGEALASYRKYNDARNEFNMAYTNTTKVEDLLSLGEIFIINRQYEAAKEAFNKVLSQDSNNIKAVRALERIQKNEEQAIAKFNIAKDFQKKGQQLAAIENLIESLSLNPYNPEAHLLLGKAFSKENYYYNAVEHYESYVNLVNIPKEQQKYSKTIEGMNKKIANIQKKGKQVKKFTRI